MNDCDRQKCIDKAIDMITAHEGEWECHPVGYYDTVIKYRTVAIFPDKPEIIKIDEHTYKVDMMGDLNRNRTKVLKIIERLRSLALDAKDRVLVDLVGE
jgi:hypothetical protein